MLTLPPQEDHLAVLHTPWYICFSTASILFVSLERRPVSRSGVQLLLFGLALFSLVQTDSTRKLLCPFRALQLPMTPTFTLSTSEAVASAWIMVRVSKALKELPKAIRLPRRSTVTSEGASAVDSEA